MRRRTFLICAGPIALLVASCGTGSTDHTEKAQTAFAAQDYISAGREASQALETDPEDKALLAILAQSFLAQGEGEGALRAAQRLGDAGGDAGQVALLQSEALLQLGKSTEALEVIESLQTPDAWRLRAIAAIHEEDDRRAAAAFARGRKLEGSKAKLLATQANWLLANLRLPEARIVVEKLREEAPERLETLFLSATLAQAEGKGAQALEAFQAILEKAPLDRPALLGAIAELGAQGRIDEIRPLVVRAREAMPQDMEFIYLDARIAAADGDWPAVRQLLQAHESRLIDHPDARGLYGNALIETGNPQLARGHLAPLYRTHPESAEIAFAYARALAETGDRDQSAVIMEKLKEAGVGPVGS